MPVLTATPASERAPTAATPLPFRADNRWPWVSWGVAYLTGWGAYALSTGPAPLLTLPALVPPVLLVLGLLAALTVTTVSVVRASRRATGPAALPGALFGAAWVVGFLALFLLITALAGALGDARVHTLRWPVGSAVVVGLLYLMGGALDRDLVQYGLGVWLALIVAAGLFLGTPGLYAVLAVLGGGGYLLAAALDHRRRRT